MTATPTAHTGSRTVLRAVLTGRPSRDDLVDAAFLFVITVLALWGFRTSFDSPRFMVVSAVGTLLGIALAHVANALKAHWLVTALLTVVAFFLFGSAVALSRDAIAGVVPDGALLKVLALMPVSGWKDFLTTLPPVDGSGQFLVLPYLIGLVAGSLGYTWARRTRHVAWPTLVPLVVFVLVILLGTLEPAAALLQGIGLCVLAFLWVALRRRRSLRIVGTGASRRSQAAIGAALLAVSAGASAGLVSLFPGPESGDRTVLRNFVTPPFDITQYPSPLVGFRKYTERAAQQLWDKPLLTVTGMPAGSLLRFSVLDSYAGTVWSAGDPASVGGSNFRRVGSTIAPNSEDSTAASSTVTLRVEPAYAAQRDLTAWIPSPGSISDISFEGARSRVLADALRYNTSTGQAVVASPLMAGDTVELTARPIKTAGEDTLQPGGSPVTDATAYPAVVASATKWGAKKASTWAAVTAAAEFMRTSGAYSDGTSPSDARYLPGHSAGRLTAFLTDPKQIVGNDEQYAATFALVANQLGMPARVVLGAVVPEGGTVRGQDVHAWVEVHDASGEWLAVPSTVFMPDRSKRPDINPPPPVADQSAANVPPPNAARPPGAIDSLLETDPSSVRVPKTTEAPGFQLPEWVVTALKVVGYPALAFALIAGAIALAHALRRRRRRSTGDASRRFAHGWTDVVDRARDLGMTIPAGLTRIEQARVVGYAPLAKEADQATFGPGEPDAAQTQEFWTRVGAARKELTKQASMVKRFGRLFSLRSLLFRDPRPVEQLPRATTQRPRRRVVIPRLARTGS
ncbi:MAG: transglutaminase domain-containing protein [Actinomycetales bacterium]|nr:transglutaminase domain-containing protein [Candidatus Lutibacillus vidarii]